MTGRLLKKERIDICDFYTDVGQPTRQEYPGVETFTSCKNLLKPIVANIYDKIINKLIKTTRAEIDITKYRSSHRRCSVRKGVLRNFAKFTGKHLCQSLFFTGTGCFLRVLRKFLEHLFHRAFLDDCFCN